MQRTHSRGLTLIELLTVLAVVAAIAGLGLPALRDVGDRARASNALHHLSATLASARTTAIHRRQPVTVCPAGPDGRCRNDPTWSGGWLIYLDPGRRDQPASEADVLRRIDGDRRIALATTAGRLRVRFQPDGRSGGSNLSIRLCSTGPRARLLGRVVVSNSGRTRSERPAGTEPCPFVP
ncbi:GspH/FimT family pseudopilin [Coralloluteibacterium thermophilus]|uniref:Type II secretion system protein H n=1 Tax=Coralloluteibacterium thermophilum TaxID=2707049 RepID=A0ABV9NJ94_9GAMM